MGHGILIGVFVLMPILYPFGWETLCISSARCRVHLLRHERLRPLRPVVLVDHLLALDLAVLGVVSIAYARRGAEDSLRARTRLALQRAPRLVPAALLFALLAVGSGSWYFYNAHVLNEYLDSKARRDIQANYERQFKQYESLLQPKVTAVDATINIYPERRSFDGNVRMTLQNKTTQPISQIHLTDEAIGHQPPVRPPVPPGEFLAAQFTPSTPRPAFSARRDRHSDLQRGPQNPRLPRRQRAAEFAYNGTFFDSDYVPYIGYNTGIESTIPAAAAKNTCRR